MACVCCESLRAVCFRALSLPISALLVVAASGGALMGAFVFQHFFDAAPCVLCLFQRVPYAVAVIFAALALLVRHKQAWARGLLGLCGLAFLVNVGLAAFHSGVEWHWWAGTQGCAVNPAVFADPGADPAAVRAALLQTAVAACDEVNFTILGLSLANINVLTSLGLALFCAAAALARGGGAARRG